MTTYRIADVHVPCEHRYFDGEQCGRYEPWDHVHQPVPCQNGQDERHHEYTVPRSVLLTVAGEKHRVHLRGAQS